MLQVCQVLNILCEQLQWLGFFNLLGEVLCVQVVWLLECFCLQQLDMEMVQLCVQCLCFEDLLSKQLQLWQICQVDGELLISEQNKILQVQLCMQNELLNLLLCGGDILMLEFIKLKVVNGQLEDVLKEINEVIYCYLFWILDVSFIGFFWLLEIVQDLWCLIFLDIISELGKVSVMMFISKEILLLLFVVLLLVGFSISLWCYFICFFECFSVWVGKVIQDYFWLMLCMVFWLILVVLLLLVLWMMFGYGLQFVWLFLLVVVIGDGVIVMVFLLWVVMICVIFVWLNGLFIVYFGWLCSCVVKVMCYYLMSIGLIVLLIMVLIMFDNFNDCEFFVLLGCLCFLLICGVLVVVILSFKYVGILFYLDKEGNGDNMVNCLLWNLMFGVLLVVMLVVVVGYFVIVQVLFVCLEILVVIWFLLLVVYYIICCWMLIQCCWLVFDWVCYCCVEIFVQCVCGEDEFVYVSSLEGLVEMEVSEVDFDVISIQLLWFVCFLLMLIVLLLVIVLWLEIYLVFGFFENILLWDVILMV